MMSRTLGAPLGGTMRGAHQAFDCRASSLITPPNFGSGAGSCLPSMVVVALGEPGVPVICWAWAGAPAMSAAVMVNSDQLRNRGWYFMVRLWLVSKDFGGIRIVISFSRESGFCQWHVDQAGGQGEWLLDSQFDECGHGREGFHARPGIS